jgi:hypothetical protein
MMNEMPKGQKIARDFEIMKGARNNWDEYWQDLAEYFIPNKDDVYGYRMDGEKKHNKLYDSTSIHSLEMLSSSLHGMLTNPASVWFGLSTGNSKLDTETTVNEYLQTCTRIMIETLNQSNFQEEIHETYLDLGGIGTTVLEIEEDEETDVRFRSSPIYSSYISENEKGVVDKLYRCFKWSLRNIKAKFGDEVFKKHMDLQTQFEKDPELKEEIIFAIYPHTDEKKAKKGKFEACFCLRKHHEILLEKEYHSWPFAVPRWTKLNHEVYGRCPAMKCLPDVKMLNAVMKTTIRGMQKVVDPPLMVPDSGFLLPINTTPGGNNFYRTGMKDRIEPFPVAARPDVGLDFVENIRSRVRESFFWDQLQLINQRDMTATEVMQRTDERLRFLGPILGRLNNELLKPIIDRVFDILQRRGRFPKPPQELKGNANLKIIYTSQIAKAQRTGEANTLIKVLQACGPMLEVQPDMLDNINGDEVLRYNANIFGLPHEMLNDPKRVKETRKARSEAQAAAQQAQMENMGADTMMKQAKAQATA